MALRIDDPEAARLAPALAARTGETVEQSVIIALRERLAREGGSEPPRDSLRPAPLPDPARAVAAARAIARHVATLPILDPRDPADILGSDTHASPTEFPPLQPIQRRTHAQ